MGHRWIHISYAEGHEPDPARLFRLVLGHEHTEHRTLPSALDKSEQVRLFHYAVRKCLAALEFILQTGIDVNARLSHGTSPTALDPRSLGREKQCIRELALEYGREEKSLPEWAGKLGSWTALHAAVHRGSPASVPSHCVQTQAKRRGSLVGGVRGIY